ncbi:MAG: sigma factor-like helix-turn-helix DNA-binding protein [Bryobacterales bacterium]
MNLLRGEIRKAVPKVQIDERDEPIFSSVDHHLDAERALDALSEQDRQLMLWHVVAGMTSAEIADRSELSAVAGPRPFAPREDQFAQAL